ncbi:hypothetical protein OQA88_8267 [Cercophora sp. LCS_1]
MGLSRITEDGLRVRFGGIKLKPVGGSFYGKYLLRNHRMQNDSFVDEDEETDAGDEKDARARERLLIVQIPAADNDESWYSIECRRPDPDSAERFDVHNSVQTKNIAIILQQAKPVGRGVLVSVEEAGEEMRVRTEFPVLIRPLGPAVSRSLSAAHECISKLDEVVAQAGDDDEKREFFIQERLLSLAAEETLAEMLLTKLLLSDHASASEKQVRESFLRDANLLSQFGGIVGEVMSERVWCVD